MAQMHHPLTSLNEITPTARPGRRFEPTHERSLDGDLRVLATQLPGARKGVIVAAELAGPRGVADLVAFTSTYPALVDRIGRGGPFVLNETDCTVVAALSPKRAKTAVSVAAITGISTEQVQRRLSRLASSGFVSAQSSGYSRRADLQPIGRAYAFEAKVSNWQQGLAQALRYATWCDTSAVVLLKPPKDLSEVTATYSSLGVGLAVRSKWILRPRLGNPHPGLRLALSETLAFDISKSDLETFRGSVRLQNSAG